jgi:hypothetical protein
MSADEHAPRSEDWTLTRRDTLRGALAGGVLVTAGGVLAACGSEDVDVPTRNSGATSLEDGHIVEFGPCEQIFTHPGADYTSKLLANTPSIAVALGHLSPPSP